MLKFPTYKIVFIIIVCLGAIYFSMPSLLGRDSDQIPSFLPQKKINLGLDLKGGSYLLLEVNFKEYFKEQLDNLKNEIRLKFRNETVNGQKIQYAGGINIVDDAVVINLINPSISGDVSRIVRDISRDLDVKSDAGKISISYSESALKNIKDSLVAQSIEIIRRRVDETGTREPDIQRQGVDRILLQVPGLNDPEHLKNMLGKTAKLTFHLLNNAVPFPYDGKTPLPPGTTKYKSERSNEYFAIQNQIMLSGDMLADASNGFGVSGLPVVNIRFNSLGSKKFADITRENVGKPFAIILDNQVLTAPVIRSAILGGSAEISGNFTTKEATDLALLLRAGALPAPLNIIEERSVGPSLGADSVESGKNAIIIGTLAVMAFMVVVYKLFGVFANIALITNILIIVAAMSIFGATLTMPGIAGIVLTIGMAVDANVLIFERIREELRNGRTVLAAVDNGFNHAFATIFDAHITTLLATLFLYMFGAGPVKGFAVTLAIGIIASLFSAILVCKMLIIFWLKKFRPKQLSV